MFLSTFQSKCLHRICLNPMFKSIYNLSAMIHTDNSFKTYDITKYKFTYSEKEEVTILDTLNNATDKELTSLKFSKAQIKKFFSYKSKIKNYNGIADLLGVDGMGIKSVEKLCDLILYGLNIFTESVHEENCVIDIYSLINKKRMVKPKVSKDHLQSIQTIVALNVTVYSLSWTYMSSNGTVFELKTEPLLTSSQRLDASQMYEKVIQLSKMIPKADIYIWEEMPTNVQLGCRSSVLVAVQLGLIRGMLMVLIDPRTDENPNMKLHTFKSSLMSKLFNLKVGGERTSGVELAVKIINGEQVFDWLPPLDLSNELQRTYFLTPKPMQTQLAISLFLAIAFQQTLIVTNQNALKLLLK